MPDADSTLDIPGGIAETDATTVQELEYSTTPTALTVQASPIPVGNESKFESLKVEKFLSDTNNWDDWRSDTANVLIFNPTFVWWGFPH